MQRSETLQLVVTLFSWKPPNSTKALILQSARNLACRVQLGNACNVLMCMRVSVEILMCLRNWALKLTRSLKSETRFCLQSRIELFCRQSGIFIFIFFEQPTKRIWKNQSWHGGDDGVHTCTRQKLFYGCGVDNVGRDEWYSNATGM